MDIGIMAPGDLKGRAEEAFGDLIYHNRQGSGGFKHQRSASLPESWRPTKIPKADGFCIGQNMGLVRSGSDISRNSGQTMISFSSQPQISQLANGVGVKSSTFPFALSSTELLCSRPASYNAIKSGAGSRGAFSRFRGPFTPSQWMELEHQAMIYKHFISNIPVPSQLLIPLRKAFNPFGLSSLISGSYASNPLGWGSFHLGFGSSSDPEPGRCRRTDGKKWRCSRDAVPDQKYCDRHINRGRHRSRKPVEGQLGHAVSGSTASEVAPNALPSSLVMSTSSALNSLGPLQHQFKSLQPNAPNGSNDKLASRLQDLHGVPAYRDTFKSKEAKEIPLSSEKQHAEFGDSMSEFGLVSPDSLLNPSHRSSCRNSDSLLALDDEEQHDQRPLRHFIDNWPEDQSNQPSSWPGELKVDWTQLSMSIPASSSEFSSSSNSPQLERPKLSPPKLSCELDSPKLGLSDMNEPNQKHADWLPVAWEDSLGGPLGEALNGGSSIVESLKSSSALDFVTDACDNNPQFGCFPAGILQKSTFAPY